MLKVQEYYTKSKIRKRQNHPNKLNKDELRQYKRENDQQTITKNKLITFLTTYCLYSTVL